jgi:hypothetical protein
MTRLQSINAFIIYFYLAYRLCQFSIFVFEIYDIYGIMIKYDYTTYISKVLN